MIPDTVKAPGRDPAKAKVLLIGAPKSGKTTLACNTGKKDTLLIATEVGYETVGGVFVVDVQNWAQYLATISAVAERPDITRIVVDTYTNLAIIGRNEVLKSLEVEALGDKGYGKGFQVYRDLMGSGIMGLMALEKQVVLVAHTREVQKIRPGGGTSTVIRSDLTDQVGKFIDALVDVTVYLDIDSDPVTMENKRWLYFQPTANLGVGGRYLEEKLDQVPGRIEIPRPKTPGWPLVEDVLRIGFTPITPDKRANGTSEAPTGGLTPPRRFVRPAKKD